MNAPESLAAFVECVAADAALRKLLAREPNHERFAEQCVREGAQRGLAFQAGDVRQCLQRTHLAWLQRNLW